MRGFVHPDFSLVATVLRRQLEHARVGGAAVSVWHRGEHVVDIWGGDRNAAGDAWDDDTLALSFCTSHGVLATALHVLADRRLVDYDAAVAAYWPEFGSAGKEMITVRQLLSHQSALHRMRPHVAGAEEMLDWDHMIKILGAVQPDWAPGLRPSFHALTWGWFVGELIQRVSGRSLQEFVRTEIVRPLDLDGAFFGVPESDRSRVAQLTRAPWVLRNGFELEEPLPWKWLDLVASLAPADLGDVVWSPLAHSRPIPSLNGTFTARSLAKIYACLAGGGVLEGTRLFSADTVREFAEIQTRKPDAVIRLPMSWRLGYHTAPTGRHQSPTAFGHWGFGGSGAWCDPSLDLAMAMVVNRVCLADFRMLRISDIVMTAARGREGRA
ncbi:MAG: beta-lactamase family protein [Acidimicrobiia bacterium]|nr:beta-lactamase family protein [Acidimicrobiia bacterium]